ncbi:hypothetical protein [Paenibacillus campinasensis]|uniref:hypothetical protein n=1 Tax=Paenibacillus campinasensis TaxID=66347 RepID=UPI0015CE9753|nr:hypothetical protein [Paenibacillus campinasensis]
MDLLQAILAAVGLIGAILGAFKLVLKEWSEIQTLLQKLKKQRRKRKKDGSPRRKG